MARRVKWVIPAIAAAALLSVPAASAGLLDPVTNLISSACAGTGEPFAQFGDGHSYYGFKNNGFESGTYGWATTGGAYVGSGNEPWFVNGSGSRSLVLPPGASATSPSFCMNVLNPSARAFARGSNGGQLKVQVIFRGPLGNTLGIFNYATVDGDGTWAPTDRLPSALGLLAASAQIRFTAASGTWQLDDAFVDPCVSLAG